MKKMDYSNSKIPNLFKLMEDRKITKAQLSRETGASSGNVSDWQSGKSLPSSERLAQIADYLGCSVNYLLGKEPDSDITPATTRQLKFALFGTADIDDDILKAVKAVAQTLKEEKLKKTKEGKNDNT